MNPLTTFAPVVYRAVTGTDDLSSGSGQNATRIGQGSRSGIWLVTRRGCSLPATTRVPTTRFPWRPKKREGPGVTRPLRVACPP